jgi:hypothetical protein
MTKDEALHLALDALECWQRNEDCNEPMSKIMGAIKAALEAKDEPVAWVCMKSEMHDIDFDQPEIDAIPVGTMLYTTSPQRTWVGLTDEDEIDWEEGGNLKDLVKAIEAKLKQKNGNE